MLGNQLLYSNPAKLWIVAIMLFNMTSRELFVKYNFALPSIVAVERLLLLGKDALKPKQSELRGEH